MEYLSLISLLANVALPPIINFAKSIFGIKDNPENTLSTLATTKPEVMPQFVESQAKYLQAEKDFFNRDVSGTPSQWVIDLRASIRPLAVAFSFIIIACSYFQSIDPAIHATCSGVIGNWIGTKIELHK